MMEGSIQPVHFKHWQKGWPEFLSPLAAFLMVAFLLFFRLGSYPLINPDEGRNAEVALEMRDSGAWLVPTLNGYPYLDKPAFYFRLVAVSMAALGKNETSARLPSALFAFALCILLYLYCRRTFGKRLAALTVVVFGSIPLVAVFARIVIFDMPLAFFTTASILSAFLAEESVGRRQRIYYILAAAAAGCGTLVKGPVGFIVPALVVFVFHIVQRQPRAILRAMHPLNLFVFFAVVLPWFIGVCAKQPDFFHYGLVEETLRRYTTSSAHPRPIWYYVPVLAGAFFPYSFLLPGAILSSWRLRKSLRPPLRLLMIWALVVVLFFSTSGSKLPGYILSAMPPLAILVAHLFELALSRPAGRSARLIFTVVSVLSFIGAALVFLLLYDHSYPGTLASLFHIRSGEYESMRSSLSFIVSSLVVLFVMAVLVLIFRRVELALAFFLILPIGLLAASFETIAHHAEDRSSRGLAVALSRLPRDTAIGCLASFPVGLRFYLERPLTLISEDGHELTSNYVTYSLRKQPVWPPGFVRLRECDHWLVTQNRPVFLLIHEKDRKALEEIAAPRGVGISEFGSGWCGAYFPGPNVRAARKQQ
jgi:multisubunit Na+/H+ antiporter MnhE subunit